MALGLIFAFQGLYPGLIGPFSDVATPLLAGVAALSGFGSLRRYGTWGRDRFSLAWLGFALGIGLWFLGEVTWDIYADILMVPVPYPSVADVFYLGGYVPLTLGVYFYVRLFARALTRRRVAVAVLLVLAAGAVMTALLIAPVFAEVADPLTRFFDFAYPTLDLLVLSLTILGFLVFFGGSIAKSWLFLLGAIALNVAADGLFTYLTAVGSYYSGSFDDLLFLWGYMLCALAFYVHRKEL